MSKYYRRRCCARSSTATRRATYYISKICVPRRYRGDSCSWRHSPATPMSDSFPLAAHVASGSSARTLHSPWCLGRDRFVVVLCMADKDRPRIWKKQPSKIDARATGGAGSGETSVMRVTWYHSGEQHATSLCARIDVAELSADAAS